MLVNKNFYFLNFVPDKNLQKPFNLSHNRVHFPFLLTVTSSLAGFLKAEELSQITNVTESQALVAMREAEVGIPHHGGVLPKYKGKSGYILTDNSSL